MGAFRGYPKVPNMDTENTSSLTAPCEFLEVHNFSYGRGDFHPCGFPTKDRPDCDRSDKVAFAMSGFHWGQESISVCTLQTDSRGPSIVISCRDMTGAFELISIVCFLSCGGLSSQGVGRPLETLLLSGTSLTNLNYFCLQAP